MDSSLIDSRLMDSGLFRSMISEESEFETETEISDIPEYDVINEHPVSNMRRRSLFPVLSSTPEMDDEDDALWVKMEEEDYGYESVDTEGGDKPTNGVDVASHKLNGYIATAGKVNNDDSVLDSLNLNTGKQSGVGQARRHSAPFRRPSMQTIPQDGILKLAAADGDRFRRGSSPEFSDSNNQARVVSFVCPQENQSPPKSALAQRRKSTLTDIPEGKLLDDESTNSNADIANNQSNFINNLSNKFSRQNKPIRRVSLPKLETTNENVPKLYTRRTSSPNVKSHYRMTERRRKSIGDVKRGRSRTVLEIPMHDYELKAPNSPRKVSLPTMKVPSIIIEDLTEPEQGSMKANGTDILKNGGNTLLNMQILNTHTSTSTEHTENSDNSTDNLLISSNGSIMGTSTTNRRKSSLLQEITAPIARRLSSLFKHMDVTKGSLTPAKTPSIKLRDRLLRRKSRCEGGNPDASQEGNSQNGGIPPSANGGGGGESPASFSNLDRVLVDIVKEDPSIVLELLEDLEELLQEDQQLSSVVLSK